MFTTRELLLSTWDDRRKMSPGDEVGFDYQKTVLRMQLDNAHRADRTQPGFGVAASMAFAERKAGVPDPETLADAKPHPRRRRKRTPAPA